MVGPHPQRRFPCYCRSLVFGKIIVGLDPLLNLPHEVKNMFSEIFDSSWVYLKENAIICNEQSFT